MKDFGCSVLGVGFGSHDDLRVLGVGFEIEGKGIRVKGFGCRVES